MNILIVGNGFDLSHYLPTKYDHFMDVMEAIETKDTGGLPKNLQEKKLQEWIRLLKQTFDKKGESETDKQFMSFEQLFSGNRDPRSEERRVVKECRMRSVRSSDMKKISEAHS